MTRLKTKEQKEQAAIPTNAQVTEAIKAANSKGKAWLKWTPEEVLAKITNIPEGGEVDVLAYIVKNLPGLKRDATKVVGVAPADHIVQSIENAVSDGAVEFSSSEGELEYELVPVSQSEVKKALKALLSNQSTIIGDLYTKHTEVNSVFFNHKLSEPLITLERLSNRTLANYTYGKNNLPIENHIRFNNTFIALNAPSAENEITTMDRVYLTLIHEMIHQWQDQVLYVKAGQTVFQEIEVPTKDTEGNIVLVPGVQKKRPKEWHNADFRSMASYLGIPCEGKHCGTGKCNMPEPVSYNRKFRCMCIASNGYPMTIWSTRQVLAVCTKCKYPYVEVIKDGRKEGIGGTIEVNKSHIELPNEDAIEKAMKEKYNTFDRFKTKPLKDAFIDAELPLPTTAGGTVQFESGTYQKQHNAYTWGYRYWVAYNSTQMAEDIDKADVEKAVEPEPKKKPKLPAESVELPRTGKIIKFETKKVPPAPAAREYSVNSPQDIIDLYKELGSVKAVGEKLGTSQATISGRTKKYNINFNEGTFTI